MTTEPCLCAQCVIDRVDVLARARRLCGEVYTPEGVDIWLNARNNTLGHERPIHLIAEGQGQRVLDVLERLVDGNF